MFTGIVQAVGRVREVKRTMHGERLVIERLGWAPGTMLLSHGESICVNGVCLTVVSVDEETMCFDVVPETLAKTNLGRLRTNSYVNLEPAATMATPMSGHFLQGHVDGIGIVTHVMTSDDEYRLTIRPTASLSDYIVEKGSVAVDGVSLTIASVNEGAERGMTFDVALIPTTLHATTLRGHKVGDHVNLEGDILCKTVVTYLRRHFGKSLSET